MSGSQELDYLIGKRVMIRAKEHDGSARLLNGLMATVIAAHPLAANWCRIQLDPNEQTEFREWSIALDRLMVMPGEGPTCRLEAVRAG